jgi:hypothetical protein
MTVRFYFDEDGMQRGLVEALRLREIDVQTALDAGMIERTDEEHLRFSTSRGRVLYSFNVADYCRLDAEFRKAGHSHAGIVLARQQRHSLGEQLRRLLKLTATRSAEDMLNAVEFLSHWG